MATESATSTKSALGRVLARRKLKARLSTVCANERDPVILMKQLQHFSAQPDAMLIKGRIDDAITICQQQIRIELNEGKARPDRAARLLSAMDKSAMSPADLEAAADKYIGAGNRTRGSHDVAAFEEELAAVKKSWGKDKAGEKYAGDYYKKADEGGMVNLDQLGAGVLQSPQMQTKLKEARALGLNEAEFTAIVTYSMQDFAYINPAVANHKDKGKGDGWMVAATGGKRGGNAQIFTEGDKSTRGSKASLYEEGAMHAGMLMEGLQKLKKHPKVFKEADLFRGTRISPGDLARLSVGSAYEFENFTSLSTSESVARQFAAGHGSTVAADRTVSVLFKLRMKAWDISGFSALPNEKELLIEPSQCTITAIEDDPQHEPGRPPATAWKIVTLTPKGAKPAG